MKKKILILGSEGQIGGHLVDFLKKKNYQIIRHDIVLNNSFDLRNIKNLKVERNIKRSDFVFFLAFED